MVIQQPLAAGGTIDDLFGGDFAPYHLSLLFDPAGLSTGSTIALLPSATVEHPGGSLTEFSDYTSTTSANLTEGTLTPEAATLAPEPASLSLLGIGVVGIRGYGRRQRRKLAAGAGA